MFHWGVAIDGDLFNGMEIVEIGLNPVEAEDLVRLGLVVTSNPRRRIGIADPDSEIFFEQIIKVDNMLYGKAKPEFNEHQSRKMDD
jgi:hypothetical protein